MFDVNAKKLSSVYAATFLTLPYVLLNRLCLTSDILKLSKSILKLKKTTETSVPFVLLPFHTKSPLLCSEQYPNMLCSLSNKVKLVMGSDYSH